MAELKRIAVIHSDFQEKFGIPRQSNLIDSLKAEVIFEPGYRDPNEVVGIRMRWSGWRGTLISG